MKRQVRLYRMIKTDRAVYGVLTVIIDGRIAMVLRTIENLSRIFPAGTYRLVFEMSPRFKRLLWELYGIKGRAEIKIHVANYWKQLEGCIGVGLSHQDIDGDGVIDLASSGKALDDFHALMEGRAGSTSTITIIDCY